MDAPARAPISACIIARDEEDRLPRCLASIAWVEDVVVVVDPRSVDGTEAVARESGARTIQHGYEGNVEQKNFALGEARFEWVLSLDADEALSPELSRAIQAELAGAGRAEGYELNRLTWHLGRWIRHGEFRPDWQLRLFRRSRARWVGLNPHGRVRVEGRTARLTGDLHHYSYRDLADQVARIQEFSGIQANVLWASGRRASVLDLVLRPPLRFLRAYLLKRGALDGLAGFVIAVATAFHVFLKYAKLWDLGRRAGPPPATPAIEAAPGEPGRTSAGP